MKHIYFFDYYSSTRNNGVNTYAKNFIHKISTLLNTKVYFVWVDSTVSLDIKEIEEEDIQHIHLPNDPIFGGENNEKNMKIVSFFKEKTITQKEVIFHFNWQEQFLLARFLKKHLISSHIILTKHYIPWQDIITSNYALFFKVHTAFEQNQKLSFMLKNKLSNEISSYKSFDHIISVTKDAKNVLYQLFEIPQEKITTIYNGIDLEGF